MTHRDVASTWELTERATGADQRKLFGCVADAQRLPLGHAEIVAWIGWGVNTLAWELLRRRETIVLLLLRALTKPDAATPNPTEVKPTVPKPT